MDVVKELMPVLVEAIKAGQSVAIWYLLVIQLVGVLQQLIGWAFVFAICKGIYGLFRMAIETNKAEAK